MFLHALGHFHPSNVIDNAFLESLDIGTSGDWITDRVGIVKRHTVLPLDYIRQTKNVDVRAAQEAAELSNAETGKRAALVALERAGLKPSDIGMVIAGGCSPDMCIPAEACRIADALGIEAPGVDIASACSSFCVQLHFIAGMRPERLPDYILVVNAENNTRVIDYSDRSSCVLWGDCSTAAIVSPRIPGPWIVEDTLVRGDPSGWDKVTVPRAGHFAQQGSAVQAFAIKRATETFLALRGDRRPDQITLIGHQANLRMLESVQKRCEVPSDRHLYNVDVRGNCGAAGAPSVMSERWDDPGLGDTVTLSVVGSGLTWSGARLQRVPVA